MSEALRLAEYLEYIPDQINREAAAELRRLHAENEQLKQASTSNATTHAHGCWSWGPSHYMCAYQEVERLREQLRGQLRGQLREQLGAALDAGEVVG